MPLDFATLDALRIHHPAWRLLRSDHATLVASFLQRVFVAPNVRVMAASDLAEALEDELYALRQSLGEDAFPRSALDYLNDWSSPEKLRPFEKTPTPTLRRSWTKSGRLPRPLRAMANRLPV